LIGFNITKPLSQKTGIDTIQPIIIIATSGRFSPTKFITISANFIAAPVFSKIFPIKAPNIITIAILENVPEKPSPITFGISLIGMPTTIAIITAIDIIAKNGCTFNLDIKNIIAIIAIKNITNNIIPDIILPPLILSFNCLCIKIQTYILILYTHKNFVKRSLLIIIIT